MYNILIFIDELGAETYIPMIPQNKYTYEK
jgi:hypothetical protein